MAKPRFRELSAIRPGGLDCYYADPAEIIVDPDYNCRDMKSAETLAHITFLAESIRQEGFSPEQPLSVRRRDDDLVLVRGHCRLAACLKLISEGVELPKIPVMQMLRGTSDADLIFDQQTSNSGLPLDSLAKARLVFKATKMGIEDAEIARRMHWKTVSSVKQHLDMLELPAEVKSMVSAGEVGAMVAVREVKASGAEQGAANLRKAKDAATAAGKERVTPRRLAESKAPPADDPLPIHSTTPAAPRPGPEDMEPGDRRPAPRVEVVKALRPFARFAFDFDLTKFGPDDVLEVPVKHLIKAATEYAKATGGEEP